GAGPRAAQNLVLGAKARAVMNGRVNVSIADVRAVAIPVLRHRIFTNFLADAEGVTAMTIVEELLKALPEPKISDEKQLEAEEAPAPVRPAAKAPKPAAPASAAAMIQVQCPKCGQVADVPRAAAGKKAKCAQCTTVFVIQG